MLGFWKKKHCKSRILCFLYVKLENPPVKHRRHWKKEDCFLLPVPGSARIPEKKCLRPEGLSLTHSWFFSCMMFKNTLIILFSYQKGLKWRVGALHNTDNWYIFGKSIHINTKREYKNEVSAGIELGYLGSWDGRSNRYAIKKFFGRGAQSDDIDGTQKSG